MQSRLITKKPVNDSLLKFNPMGSKPDAKKPASKKADAKKAKKSKHGKFAQKAAKVLAGKG
jgi:hypothetical protein